MTSFKFENWCQLMPTELTKIDSFEVRFLDHGTLMAARDFYKQVAKEETEKWKRRLEREEKAKLKQGLKQKMDELMKRIEKRKVELETRERDFGTAHIAASLVDKEEQLLKDIEEASQAFTNTKAMMVANSERKMRRVLDQYKTEEKRLALERREKMKKYGKEILKHVSKSQRESKPVTCYGPTPHAVVERRYSVSEKLLEKEFEKRMGPIKPLYNWEFKDDTVENLPKKQSIKDFTTVHKNNIVAMEQASAVNGSKGISVKRDRSSFNTRNCVKKNLEPPKNTSVEKNQTAMVKVTAPKTLKTCTRSTRSSTKTETDTQSISDQTTYMALPSHPLGVSRINFILRKLDDCSTTLEYSRSGDDPLKALIERQKAECRADSTRSNTNHTRTANVSPFFVKKLNNSIDGLSTITELSSSLEKDDSLSESSKTEHLSLFSETMISESLSSLSLSLTSTESSSVCPMRFERLCKVHREAFWRQAREMADSSD